MGEPTGLDVCTAARGNFGGQITLYGEHAHASNPDDGHNPISDVGPLLQALEEYDDQHGPSEHRTLGRSTLTPPRIESGGPLN